MFLVSLYWLMTQARQVRPELDDLANVIGVHDHRSLNFPFMISSEIWSKGILDRLKKVNNLSEEKYKRYIRYVLPCCLNYGTTPNSQYSLDEDIDTVLKLTR